MASFSTALFALQRGHKVKRHHWDGYWKYDKDNHWDGYWKYDKDNNTIIMHTFDGRDVRIQDTKDIIYTLSSCADDWEIVNDWKENKIKP